MLAPGTGVVGAVISYQAGAGIIFTSLQQLQSRSLSLFGNAHVCNRAVSEAGNKRKAEEAAEELLGCQHVFEQEHML